MFECQNIVGSLLCDGHCDVFLATHCVNGDGASRHIQSIEHFGNCRYLVGTVVNNELTQNQLIGGRSGTNQVGWRYQSAVACL